MRDDDFAQKRRVVLRLGHIKVDLGQNSAIVVPPTACAIARHGRERVDERLVRKFRCEPVLIVVTQNRATARWAAEPIYVGVPGRPSMAVWPFVLGPENVPVIADEREAARDVPLAVLSAMTHGRGRQAPAILESLASALRTIDRDTAAVFAQFVDSCLADPRHSRCGGTS